MTTKILTVMTLLSFAITSCTGQNPAPSGEVLQKPTADATHSQILVITQVKKPWYAWRSLVAGRMKESIPEYQQIPGLQEKYYSFTEDHKRFGGIYFWKNQTDANQWFNANWFQRIEKKYGEKGIVTSYQIVRSTTVATAPQSANDLYAVLSYANKDLDTAGKNAAGLLKHLALQDSAAQTCSLTIWKDEESAKDFFKGSTGTHQFFDIPFFIVNP
jgi:heme-degrading monooxygenase HmoA